MTNNAKKRGSTFESLIRDYLRAAGIPAERMPAGARADRGDLAAVEDWTLELKAFANLAEGIREGLADLAVEQANADTLYGAVIVKRRGKTAPGDQLVVMTMDQFTFLLLEQRKHRRAA